jgi:hypothetical protein
MLIAKLRVSLKDCGIQYNSSAELETAKVRGSELVDGKIIRGLGTHFASKEAKERFDRLTAKGNKIREQFNQRFLRTPLESTFVVTTPGEAKEFAKQFDSERPDIDVSVFEFELGATAELDEKEMKEWGERVKSQLKRVPLGRGEEVDEDGLTALLTLASCPVLAQETRDRINGMVAEVRVGKMNRADFKRGISILPVVMEQSTLLVPRSRPEPVA